ncbi:hypothetical protein CDD80_4778 [Ophiocordyceps camponoti-rufipedis]|uniref:RRM domain-containing protein n=1 Tax=Ophiocordyceps camponoti-rufipedis TaxID=2004952 RepID=A0A2C5YXL2_9HYPO|nr:hypothetical protein CDD80_4778 [Ophiocordyceps camponoti-rufipedis]
MATGPDDAIRAGRRIYLGNLPYTVKPYDVEELLVANGFDQCIDNIHISIDPVSARNPGYCFVDFVDRDTAERALADLKAEISNRPLKVGPCQPKRSGGARDDSSFERWGDWRGKADDGRAGGYTSRASQQGPHGALDHFDDIVSNHEGRRVFLGGLRPMVDQAQNHREVREIFADFNPTAIGKRITPRAETRREPGNHHYCFVDFKTRTEAASAIKALNGKPVPGGSLTVALARGIPEKLLTRHFDAEPEAAFRRPRQATPTTGPSKAMASTDWRRAADG